MHTAYWRDGTWEEGRRRRRERATIEVKMARGKASEVCTQNIK